MILRFILVLSLFSISCGKQIDEDKIYQILDANVVHLVIPQMGQGTGFVVSLKSGSYILTNAHVCENGDDVIWVKHKEERFIPRKIIEYPSELNPDICIIESIPGMKGLKLGTDWHSFEMVWSLGFPKGIKQKRSGTIGGEMYRTRRFDFNFYYVNFPAQPGQSGSPVVNRYGEVIGIIFAGDDDGRTFVVSISEVLDFLRPYNK